MLWVGLAGKATVPAIGIHARKVAARATLGVYIEGSRVKRYDITKICSYKI